MISGKRMGATALLAMALAAMSAGAATAALPIGTKAPDFTTRGAKGGKVFRLNLAEILKKGPVVLYFFPAAFTPGCTAETREFADKSAQFAAAGATIIGLSADPVDKLQRFSTEECRSKFAVASAGPDIIKAYDVALANLPVLGDRTNRTSYVITREGRIAFVLSEMDHSRHVASTLAAVRSLPRPRK